MSRMSRSGTSLAILVLGGALAACSTPGLEPTTAPAPTVRVTPTPAPTAVPLAISKVSVTESVAPGDKAKVVITTAAAAECTIVVTYDSGPSQASGLEGQTADAAGKSPGRGPLAGTRSPARGRSTSRASRASATEPSS